MVAVLDLNDPKIVQHRKIASATIEGLTWKIRKLEKYRELLTKRPPARKINDSLRRLDEKLNMARQHLRKQCGTTLS